MSEFRLKLLFSKPCPDCGSLVYVCERGETKALLHEGYGCEFFLSKDEAALSGAFGISSQGITTTWIDDALN